MSRINLAANEADKATAPGFWARLGRTPVSDLVRGRVSGRMHAKGQAADAKLPAGLEALITRTVHATRLRHIEQHAVAEELIALVSDALEAGESSQSLVERFGAPAEAARLFRVAGLRRRSHAQRAFRRVLQGGVAVVVLLIAAGGVLLIRHTMSRPAIARDFRQEIERTNRNVPPEQRAWPVYRRALVTLETFPDNDEEINEQAYLNAWPQISEYLERNRPAFDLARQAADKPRMGYWSGDPDDEDWLARVYLTGAPDERNLPLYYASTPHTDRLAHLRRLLLADSRRAAAAGDGDVFVSNIQALLGMAEHLRDGTPSVMTELRAFACYGSALQLVRMLVEENPQLLDDEQIVDLAHRIAAYSGGGTLRARLDGEQLLFEDLIQRIYSDNGAGDGALTLEGYELWRRTEEDLFLRDEEPPAGWQQLVRPLESATVSIITVGRREVSQLAERLMLRFQAERAGPLWQWDESTAEVQVQQLLNSPIQKARYWPVLYVFPGLRHLALRGEVLTQQRDATLAALGLEYYRRRHDEWPDTLNDLTPFPLPAVPMDRFTGRPLCYRVVDGNPLLYSTGLDRDDDGGRPHRMGNELAQRWEPWVKVKAPPRLVHDEQGNPVRLPPKFDWDWILWPEPKPVLADDTEADPAGDLQTNTAQ